jgi:hypothetical protein
MIQVGGAGSRVRSKWLLVMGACSQQRSLAASAVAYVKLEYLLTRFVERTIQQRCDVQARLHAAQHR